MSSGFEDAIVAERDVLVVPGSEPGAADDEIVGGVQCSIGVRAVITIGEQDVKVRKLFSLFGLPIG